MSSSTTTTIEKHYTPQEVAEIWGLHRDTVRNMFKDEPGVLKLVNGKKKRNATLRIPQSVLDRVHLRNLKA